LYPVCTDGFLRSQVLYLVLQAVKRRLGTTKGVNPPHGALSGYDPFILNDISKELLQHYRFISDAEEINNDSGAIDKTFDTVFGLSRTSRFGQEKCGPNPNLTLIGVPFPSHHAKNACIKSRETMRQYFDLYYYRQKTSSKNRAIYCAFGSALSVVIDRLMEVNTLPGTLNHVVIIALPFGVKAFTTDLSAKQIMGTYGAYASLFIPAKEN